MQLENQVSSLELSKRLKEIGVKQDSLFVWISIIETGFNFIKLKESFEPDNKEVGAYNYSAFTVSELFEMLPNVIQMPNLQPFDNFGIRINKFISIDQKMKCINNFIINYVCDTTETEGENAWFSRRLINNIYDPNLANALAKMLIYLIENELLEDKK